MNQVMWVLAIAMVNLVLAAWPVEHGKLREAMARYEAGESGYEG